MYFKKQTEQACTVVLLISAVHRPLKRPSLT